MESFFIELCRSEIKPSANCLPRLKPSSLAACRRSKMDELLVKDRLPAPEGAYGGSSAELAVPSCLKKAGPKSPQVRGITWETELAVAQDGVVCVSPMEFGRTLSELEEEVVVISHSPPAVVKDYCAEAFQRALALKEKEQRIIAEAHDVARATLVESFGYNYPVAYVKRVKQAAEANLLALREELLEGHDVHHKILFEQAFLEKLPKFKETKS